MDCIWRWLAWVQLLKSFLQWEKKVLHWISRHDHRPHLKSDWVTAGCLLSWHLQILFLDTYDQLSDHLPTLQSTAYHPWWTSITLPNGHFPCGIISSAIIKARSPGMKQGQGFIHFSLFCSVGKYSFDQHFQNISVIYCTCFQRCLL